MSSISCLNPKAELARNAAALEMNISGARGLQEVMKTNLGPKGTLKMLVSGSGDLKLTKDGNVLLHEMQIQHPTASMIARACTAQNDAIEMELHRLEGVHPRMITEGFELAYKHSLELLDKFKKKALIDRDLLIEVAQTSLRTKLHQKLADHITECVVDAVMAIRKDENDTEPDLHMIEIQQMEHESDTDTKFIRGLGEDKYTFIEDCKNPKSVTLLLKGPNKHTIEQIKDAIYDGIRAVFNVLKDSAVVPGAGAFEIAAYCSLVKLSSTVKGRASLGVLAFANAFLVIPKTLAINSGYDAQEVILKLVEAYKESANAEQPIGLDLQSGEPFVPQGVWDNVSVKRSSIEACHSIASHLLEVDEVIRAGMTNLKTGQ
uniref:Uncharacterized protein n=1 Tax=Ditylenchus dipsaci TaxID=166011 RepID=A0A915EQY6_9BILA